jgi:Cu2+-exporting ATPase
LQVMMYAFPAYVADSGEITPDVESLMRWASLILTLPVMAYSAAPFLRGAWRDVRVLRPRHGRARRARALRRVRRERLGQRSPRAARSISTRSRCSSSCCSVGVISSCSRAHRAGLALQHLARLAPHTAQRLRGDSASDTEAVPAAHLVPGDRVLVRAGDHVPADGELESGEALVSEAWVSGESRPLAKRTGDALTGGSVNLGEAFVLRVRRAGADTALAAIPPHDGGAALDERPRWIEAGAARLGNLRGRGARVRRGGGARLVIPSIRARAVWIAVSVLVVTCPCALALATPAALTVAGGALARRQPGGRTRPVPSSVSPLPTVCVFDKTGTLTQGAATPGGPAPAGHRDPALCRRARRGARAGLVASTRPGSRRHGGAGTAARG